MKIAICDDDMIIGSSIETILLKDVKIKNRKLEIEVFTSGEELIASITSGTNYDLIYLDIEMGGVNGIEVGHFLRKKEQNFRTEIVYISGKDCYDRQLFDVQPLHFIPKPIDSTKVIASLELALQRGEKTANYFTYTKGGSTLKIPMDKILYFESLNREVRIVLEDGEDNFYGSLESISLKVCEYGFARIHRSYLVNFGKATVVRYDEIQMPNNIALPISRMKRIEIRNLQLDKE